MSKTVLIVEKDLALMKSVREGLTTRGFTVEETTDGKGAPDLIRKQKPDLVVLAVDLDAGQNGYIICKKLKSDNDLKGVPVVIIGDPKGFESHQKLKTRAEDYVGKPLDVGALIDRVGGLVGFPAVVEESFDPASILDESPIDEIAIETPTTEDATGADPDFEMVDSMFEEKAHTSATETEPPVFEEEISINTNSGEELSPEDKTTVGFMPPPPPPPLPKRSPEVARTITQPAAPPPFQSSGSMAIDPAEARELRSKVTELTGSLDEARTQASEFQARVHELEAQLEARQAELDTAKSAPAKGDSKEIFALKDAANKKDKEILRLKNELNAKEQELVELRDKENSLEQQASESSGELAKRDAQIKTLQTKADQLGGERKKVDQQLLTAREEARSSSARLSTLQSDYDALQARVGELEAQLDPMRQAQQDAETSRAQAESDLSEARGEIEALKSQHDERQREHDELRTAHDQAQMDLDSTRSQLTSQATSFADEISGLRQRLADAEADQRKHEERAARHQSRVKAQQDHLERLRTSLQAAMQTLDEAPSSDSEDLDIDELAEA